VIKEDDGTVYLKDVINSYLTHRVHSPESIEEFPYYTNDSRWETIRSSGWDDWVAGFLPGINWLGASVDNRLTDRARAHTTQISDRHTHNFNIGFRNQYSWLSGYEVTGDREYKQRTKNAVDRLLDCFHPAVNLIGHRTHDELHVSATDAMMNLPLLMWSYHHGYKPVRCRWVVEQTLATAQKQFVRKDGGVHHLLKFDGRTGRLTSIESRQGELGGCWSRGLAWMTTGLVLGGICFNRSDFLLRAQDLMLYHWRHTNNLVPPYDYQANTNDQSEPPLDTSAGAILASGMILLGKHEDDYRLKQAGQSIVNYMLFEHRRPEPSAGLIGGSSFHVPENTGVNEATIWGDFYTLESLYLMEEDHLPPHLNWLNAA